MSRERSLNRLRGFDRVSYRAKSNDPTVAHAFQHLAAAFCSLGLEPAAAQLADQVDCAWLVRLHRGRVVDHVGHQYYCKSAFHN